MRHAWIPFLALPFVAATAASQGAPPPGGAAALRGAIRATQARLDALVAAAKVDQRMDVVRAYLAFSAEQLKDQRRTVTVYTLLDIVNDSTASEEARDAAANAIGSDAAKRQDPDLSSDGRGLKRPRAAFSMRVTTSLTDDDVMTRGLAERILEALWPQANEAPILQYNPRVEKTWKPAKKSWQDHLRK